MKKFTGFNLREWLNKNVNLEEDLTPNFRKFLEDNNLLKYLNW